MTKVFITSALFLTASVAVRADSIRLTTGKYLNGRVAGYTNSGFQVDLEGRGVTNLPALSVQTIDFENDSAIIVVELSRQASTKGRISLYDKGAFSIENEDGQVDRVPLRQVANITFGGPIPTPSATPKQDAVQQVNAPKPSDVPKVEQIEDNDLLKHIVRGKVTIVDFYADWCGPCRMIGPYLEELAQKSDAVVLRKVNVDHNRKLAEQFGIDAIPNITVYDKSAKSIGTIRGADRDGVARLVDQASR